MATKILIGQCDCCGKNHRLLHRTVFSGLDTSACSFCCQRDPEEDREDIESEIARLRPNAETGEQWARICELECALS